MGGFWPHDAVGWIAIIGPSLGILGWLLNIYVKQPLDRLTAEFEKSRADMNARLDNHELRLNHLEDMDAFKERGGI